MATKTTKKTDYKIQGIGNVIDGKQQGYKKDDAWKQQIYDYYRNSANQSVKESDKQYGQAIANSENAALARGMGRSSYALATSANLENQKTQAANQIRTNAENEANMAILNQQNVVDQLAFQQAQAAQEQANWQAQFDANQAQQAWQNQFQQAQFNWQQQQAAAANAAASGGYSGSSGYWDTRKQKEETPTTTSAYDLLMQQIEQTNQRLKQKGRPQIQPYNNLITGSISMN